MTVQKKISMTFEEKVKFLRALPQFKVIPITEVRAIAFAAREIDKQGVIMLGKQGSNSLYLNPEDAQKITRAYPDLAPKLK